MKKLFGFLFGVLFFTSTFTAKAQLFTVAHDTVKFDQPTSLTTFHNDITVPGFSSVAINWQIDSTRTTFPLNWIFNDSGGTSFCDNINCYGSNIDTSCAIMHATYPTGTHDFTMHMGLNPSYRSADSFYITIKFTSGSQTSYETFMAKPYYSSVPTVNSPEETLLYPNPATSSVNIVYDQSLDIRNIAIYNIIGKMMTSYKVNNNSANLNIENLNSGIYFLHLINSRGNVVLTRKFTKQ